MKMWSMRVIILLLFCYSCLSTDNRNQAVYFESRNFYNVLHWVPVEPAFPGQKILYSVKYWSDAKEGQPYQMKEDCQNITALSCDLTAETPSVYDVHYRAQVYVNGRVHGRTTSFKPLAETKFGPPSLSYYTTASSLHVDVSLPLGPKGVSVADIITRSKNGTVIVYVTNITQPKWAARVTESQTGRFVINLKNNQTEYCGYVVYMPSAEWGRPKSENASFCATLQGNHLKILPWLLVSAALLLAVVVISIVCICYYVRGGKEKKMPKSLVTPFNTLPRVMKFLDGNRHISEADFNTQGEPTVYATIQVKPNVSSVGAGDYSPQDAPWPTCQGSDSSEGTGARSPTSNPEDTSAQSSEIYSVVAVHVPAKENQDGQQGTTEDRQSGNVPFRSSREDWDKGGIDPELTTHGVPTPDLDSNESNAAMPLLLHTVRDSNGQLMLPSLTFQITTGGSEMKPLLSDLIDSHKEGPSLASIQSFDSSEWSDSGCGDSTVNTPTHPYCNTNYCPSQPVVPYLQQGCQNTPSGDATFESGYKQNWTPTILLGTLSKDSCGYRRTETPWPWAGSKTEEEAEEDDVRENEETSREILLGAWGIQIQE